MKLKQSQAVKLKRLLEKAKPKKVWVQKGWREVEMTKAKALREGYNVSSLENRKWNNQKK